MGMAREGTCRLEQKLPKKEVATEEMVQDGGS
jgi:hypothetical protein